ncbi:MAG: methionine synthase [Candidatus Sericytochromatia bacterium]|nr:methionine synthase [Candidatus Sericytochromatia bacterium]
MSSRFREALKQRILILDGALGSNIMSLNLTLEDYGGREGCNEGLILSRPDVIERVHASFFAVGCDAVETDTFGGSRLKLEEYGLGNQTVELNAMAAQLARRVADRFDGERFVVGSIGPTGMLPSSTDPSLSDITLDQLEILFHEQAIGLIEGGCDALLIETSQDILEVRAAIMGLDRARRDKRIDVPIMAQVTLIDANGRMLLGTDIGAVVATLSPLPIDVIGLNCSTGPAEMIDTVRFLGENCARYVSVVPNAGIPENVDGRAHYPLEPAGLADYLERFVSEFGANIVGGCCGTTPEHMRAVVERVAHLKPKPRPLNVPTAVSSAMRAQLLTEETRPIIVGERVNSQGSRKVKELLIADDYEGLVAIARHQTEGGAHLLDICTALTERFDEGEQMRMVTKLLANSVDAPLVIDSTEADVIETALKVYPGRAIINSINLEGSGDRIPKIVPLAKLYGSLMIAMTIDEVGMALTADRKVEVAKRIYDIVTGEYEMPAESLIYDALTFTLATGEDAYVESAKETIEGIRRIKSELPGVRTCLGISNVSFGLSPHARGVLNSAFLYHCVQAGLDLAIVNPKDIIPYPSIPLEERELADDLIYYRRPDALAQFIQHYTNAGPRQPQGESVREKLAQLPVEERLHQHILHRIHEGLDENLAEAMQGRSPVGILNEVLLPAMKDVGDKFGSGELILPFVLQSAEVMKKSVAYLEQFLEKNDSYTKGTVVLATVYGDVHDIGKNLVKTILSNNGFIVHDLGKQVPIQTIIAKAQETNADVIGLSALLVSTSKQMPACVKELDKLGLSYPVMIGGAAINRPFGYRAMILDEERHYDGGVYYCKDAFEGLDLMNALAEPGAKAAMSAAMLIEAREGLAVRAEIKARTATVVRTGARSDTPPAERIPTPPFWGWKHIHNVPWDEIWPILDLKTLYSLHWGVRGKDKDELARLIETEFEPIRLALQQESMANGYMTPNVAYGYFPVRAEGDNLHILAADSDEILTTLTFSRQMADKHLCLADYFSPVRDVAAFHVVTAGQVATEWTDKFQAAHEYTKSYYLHGLAVEVAEALAAWVHRRIRDELGMEHSQGQRYSPGYPAWPQLEAHRQVLPLLNAEALGISLTVSDQIVPEQSTCAIIVHHPAARYYAVSHDAQASVS